MKVRVPFITLSPKNQIFASLRLIKIRTFSKEHPEGVVTPGHLYMETQHLPKPLFVAPELDYSKYFEGEPI